jgi:hypothetical protein
MKLTLQNQRRRAMAMISVIIILSMLLLLVAANLRALNTLGGELRLLEQRQRSRIGMPRQTVPPQPVASNPVPQELTR